MTESLRLAKHLASLLACSRRDAEIYIEGGWVTVDGRVVEEPGFRVREEQDVVLAPDAKLEDVTPVTILLHKPAGYRADDGPNSAVHLITPESLMPGDRSGRRFLRKYLNGLELVTPLDMQASGLVVYTQEHAVSRKLLKDASVVEQEFVVEVSGTLVDHGLNRLKHGLSWRGKPLAPAKVSWQNETHLRFATKTPAPGQIAYMCSQVGLTVLSIKRLRIGRLPMAGLQPGQWRYRLDYERF